MLVLTRRNNEAIILGDDIKITILEIDSDRVKIGIEAPQSLKILRAELLAEVRNVNREAMQANLSFMQAISEPGAPTSASAAPAPASSPAPASVLASASSAAADPAEKILRKF